MTTNFLKGILASLFASILLVSCEKTANEISQNEQLKLTAGTLTVLGKKLPNPYEPENVIRAWQNLSRTRPELTKDINMDFNPTHILVKFAPKDAKELEQLESRYGLDLSDIPPLHEYTIDGDYYIDPAVEKGKPTFQYATLAVGTELPGNIKHEVLEKLILMDFSKEINGTVEYYEELDGAYHHELYSISRLTEIIYGNAGQRGLLWRPSGELKFQRPDGSIAPAANILVSMLNVLRLPIINTGMKSDSKGKFSCGRRIIEQAHYKASFRSDLVYISNIRDGSPLRLKWCISGCDGKTWVNY